MAHSSGVATLRIPKAKGKKKPKGNKFPLYLHKTGHYAKKVRGRVHYFGKDKDAVLARWLEDKDDLLAGRTVRPKDGTGHTLGFACNALLTQKQSLVDTGELSPRTWEGYLTAAKLLTVHFGRNRLLVDLRPEDFVAFRTKVAEGRGPVRVGNILRNVRGILRYAYDHDLIDRPFKVSKVLAMPSRKVVRAAKQAHEQQHGKRLFSAEDLRTVIDKAPVPLKAMVLLGINCGFGQTDCSKLTQRCISLDSGWHKFPRPKTAIERRCPLWPETVEALEAALKARKMPKDASLADRVFITKYRDEFVKARTKEIKVKGVVTETKVIPQDAVALTFGRLLTELDLKRDGLNFYALHHTFETVAGGCGDQVAVDYIMGHAPAQEDMSAVYREGIDDERLRKVADHVKAWLRPAETKTTSEQGE